MKFFKDHVIQILIATIVSLVTIIGGYVLATIKSDLNRLECRIAESAVRNEYSTLQLKFIVSALDDVKRDSEFFSALARMISIYKPSLEKCAEGADELAQIDSYRNGLEAYIDRNWDVAIQNFSAIRERTTLTEKSVGNALLHKAEDLKRANDPKSIDVLRQARAHISDAYELATKESDYSIKERAIAYLDCDTRLLDQPDDDALNCLHELVNSGLANYVTHYNLSALDARDGKFKESVEEMKQCMKMPGAERQHRLDVETDPDFRVLLSDQIYGPIFKSLLTRLAP